MTEPPGTQVGILWRRWRGAYSADMSRYMLWVQKTATRLRSAFERAAPWGVGGGCAGRTGAAKNLEGN